MKGLIIKYTLFFLPIWLGLAAVAGSEGKVGYWIAVTLTVAATMVTGLLLYDIALLVMGDDISEVARKKYITNIGIVTSQLVVLIVLSAIFYESYLLSMLGTNVILITISIMLARTVRSIHNARPGIGCLLCLLIMALVVIIVISNVMFFVRG